MKILDRTIDLNRSAAEISEDILKETIGVGQVVTVSKRPGVGRGRYPRDVTVKQVNPDGSFVGSDGIDYLKTDVDDTWADPAGGTHGANDDPLKTYESSSQIPSNIEEFAKRKGLWDVVKKVNSWIEKASGGKDHVRGGTAIGKNYNTLVLDINRESGDVYIHDGDEGGTEIKLFDEPVRSYQDFKRVWDENNKPEEPAAEGEPKNESVGDPDPEIDYAGVKCKYQQTYLDNRLDDAQAQIDLYTKQGRKATVVHDGEFHHLYVEPKKG